ncbi:phosphotransferase [Aliiroseovarius sp. KMU-50]|uniref:Phosphotransferase n=1 Tax=Aliiroseovarius salicola TaxID=3009082 RepID=A0ABT4W3N5_9RHOB|nr:phosphotransferase [Aliiroseovarius sp. KMU-50]MDA5095109.1 phosphotransferase [Aliiroseovarius sp. KMU-50]
MKQGRVRVFLLTCPLIVTDSFGMTDRDHISPPATLKSGWEQRGIAERNADWARQSGGHSNPVWRVLGQDRDIICKLYVPSNHSPIFSNDPDHEAISLTALAGTGIAPKMLGRLRCEAGESLAYSYLDGPQWRGNVQDVAVLMAHLHLQPVPDGLNSVRSDPDVLIDQTRQMQPEMRISPMPEHPLPPVDPVFLHGDIVPGNLVETSEGLMLIDWQCPAKGDPCLDIAIFLSPAMQVIYGHHPLSEDEIGAFFTMYGHPNVTERYQILAPFFHTRMAAYCLWKGARGSASHAAAAVLELEALEKL